MKQNEEVFDTIKEALLEILNIYIIGNCSNPYSNPSEQKYIEELSPDEEKIISKEKAKIPSLQEIIDLAVRTILEESPNLLESSYIKNNFSDSVINLEHKAYNIYLKHEENSFHSIINEWVKMNEKILKKIVNKFPNPKDFTKEICKKFYPIIKKMEFRSSQTRKARGGRTFEYIVEYLLKRIDISCERPSGEAAKILKRVDLVIPNQDIAIKRPDESYILSCKRTLRERWKQTVPERKPSWRVFLITIDEDLSEGKALEIDKLGMIIYVKDDLKNKSHLQKKEWVRRLSELPMDITL